MVMASTVPAPSAEACGERKIVRTTVGVGGVGNVTFGISTPHALKAAIVCAARAGVDAPR